MYITEEIRTDIKEWLEFLQRQGKNPTNTKPFWQRLNKLKGNKISKSKPT